MLEFLLFCVLLLVGGAFAALVAVPLLIVVGVIWLITLPIRLFFWLVFGALGLVFSLLFGAVRLVVAVIGGLLGLLFAPVVLVLGAVALGIAFVVWLISALAPLVPLILVGLLIWGIYRLVAHRPSPTF